jgi:prepilin-type N-terminal cleavage/methylation domain-containing protein
MRGTTLLELLVVMVVLGVCFGVAGAAFGSLRAPRGAARGLAAREARVRAIRTGRPVRLPGETLGARPAALFLPDGRAIGPGFGPLTGAPSDVSH